MCSFTTGKRVRSLAVYTGNAKDFVIEVGVQVVLTVKMGLGGCEVLYCQKILKIYKPAESAFSAISHFQL